MSNNARFGLVLVALTCGSLIQPRASAQAAYGNIIGTVTDQSGAAVPGAKVTATDRGKGVTYAANANESGEVVSGVKLNAPLAKVNVLPTPP